MTLRGLNKLKFNKDGLIPAIIQDSRTNKVLMMAWMNREALEKTLSSGQTWFWSRSRQKLWHKGETSGHVQDVEEIYFDCDADTLLIKVEQHGAACHEGYDSCFHYLLNPSGGVAIVGDMAFNPEKVYGKNAVREEEAAAGVPADPPVNQEDAPGCSSRAVILDELFQVIRDRKQRRPAGAYTSYLFDKGLDKILKKVGEETAETIIAAKNHSASELTYETADLLYHLMVLLVEQGVSLDDVYRELEKRRHK
ncbi:MAG: bifunctional phosphoribosyl-AMP cyclohydrolase/phosphoribosyl-ATP diphosphatase HisIE [Peptococcaceae bacterium]|nr:bifunctional phosphoribosyl-AMP cyclohydrolase/phosphoribosyl-ATP diphosphatase HisIE [Peptococcaceae bacterium]